MNKIQNLAYDMMMNITKMGKTLKSEKFMKIFTQIWAKAKTILNFSDLSIFPIFIIFIFKLDTNFPWPMVETCVFFRFYSFFKMRKLKKCLIIFPKIWTEKEMHDLPYAK